MAQHFLYPIPADEARRLAALEGYQVLDTGSEPGLDMLVRHAQRLFGVPMALISFVDRDRRFFKAHVGVDVCETSRDGSFCAHAILGHDLLVVPDATRDDRFSHARRVGDGPEIRFYAGAPLVTPDGFVIGAFCVQDTAPRPDGLCPAQRQSLRDLAALVMDKLEVRRLSTNEIDGCRRFQAVAGSSADAIICADGSNRILSWNSAAQRMFGYGAEEVMGLPLGIVIPERFRAMHDEGMQRVVSGLPTRLVGRLVTVPALRRDGTEFPIELSLSHWFEGGEHRFGAIARDITERLATEAQLKRAAEYDALTGLANRMLLNTHLVAAGDGRRPTSLILLDLDGFKDVNDSLGHAAGDEVLRAVADRLRHVVGDRGLPCRMGGDEFVIVLRDADEPASAVGLADLLIRSIERPIELGERCVYVGASAGVSFVSGESWQPEAMLEQADLALYQAKADGKGRVRLFTPDLRPVALTRISVSSGLRKAWEQGEFELHYQPQVRLRDQAIVGAEALIRWNHPERGLLTPAAFLSTLENSLLAVPVSEWILRTACRQAAAWDSLGHRGLRMGINLFAAQLRSGDLPALVDRVLGETRLPAAALELEITENTILRNESRIHSALKDLRDLGIGIAFDDYGTGFASLTMLKDFPVTRLKIDRTFVSGSDSRDRNLVIVEAISRLAQGFDLEVIAEGIETREQADLMQAYCHEGQGYFFGKPMPASTFEQALGVPAQGARPMQEAVNGDAAPRGRRPSASPAA
jgi:diguanylate cyclase (GGDEF)-like protein/PAS domain S-box-containing protein